MRRAPCAVDPTQETRELDDARHGDEGDLPVNTQMMRERLRRLVDRVPGLHVIVEAVRGYIAHQSANQAGSVAFSSVLAMFPLLILIAATAAFVGRPGDAAALAERIIGYAPPLVRAAVLPAVDQLLRQPSQALLAIGVIGTLWTASSGMQAVRTALNKAYNVESGLSFWRARIKVTLFTIVVVLGTLAAFSSVVVMPYAWRLLESTAPAGTDLPRLLDMLRYALAFVVLTALYALMYAWLPDIRQKLRSVLPGAVLGAAMWVTAAATLSNALRGASKVIMIYGGFAGAVATLVFLYVSAVTLIFGAELNSVLRRAGDPVGRPSQEKRH